MPRNLFFIRYSYLFQSLNQCIIIERQQYHIRCMSIFTLSRIAVLKPSLSNIYYMRSLTDIFDSTIFCIGSYRSAVSVKTRFFLIRTKLNERRIFLRLVFLFPMRKYWNRFRISLILKVFLQAWVILVK